MQHSSTHQDTLSLAIRADDAGEIVQRSHSDFASEALESCQTPCWSHHRVARRWKMRSSSTESTAFQYWTAADHRLGWAHTSQFDFVQPQPRRWRYFSTIADFHCLFSWRCQQELVIHCHRKNLKSWPLAVPPSLATSSGGYESRRSLSNFIRNCCNDCLEASQSASDTQHAQHEAVDAQRHSLETSTIRSVSSRASQ